MIRVITLWRVLAVSLVALLADPAWPVCPNPNPNPAQRASGDLNGDCATDVIWRNAITGENYIWFMNGTAQSQISPPGFTNTVDPASGWAIAGFGDFDGDGRAYVLWRALLLPACSDAAMCAIRELWRIRLRLPPGNREL